MNSKKIAAGVLAATGLVAAATAALAQPYYDPEYIGYRYTYYSDAEKTIYAGDIWDEGCGGDPAYVYVVRANVPSAYFTKEAVFYCGNGYIEPIMVG